MSHTTHRRHWFAAAMALGLTVSFVAGAAPGANAVTQGTYVVSRQGGVSFSLLNKNDLLLGTTDDALFRLTTSLSGVNHLPFPITVYNHTFKKITVSSNGNVQFGVCCSGGSTAFGNESLPSSQFTGPAISVFWDDLFMEPDDTSHFFNEGLFVKTSGHKPHRQFTISWQGHSYNSESYFVLAQVVFFEGSQKFKTIYGAADNQGSFVPSETIGVQGIGGTSAPFTQVAFDPPPPGVVVSGRQYTFQHTN